MRFPLFHRALLESCHTTALTVAHLAAVFIARHWFVGLANAVATALLGLGLLRAASFLWPLVSRPSLILQLKRFVLLVALYKGALYLVVGVSLKIIRDDPVLLGGQLAPIPYMLCTNWGQYYSIWHPTAATYDVTLALVGLAVGLLVRRAYRVAVACQELGTFKRVGGHVDPRVQDQLQKAASALGFSATARLPAVILAEVACATPVLLGVSRPFIVIAPSILAALNDDELEVALRHELAHLKRRDHWWRWLILWMEDIGWPMLLAGRLGAFTVEMEEQLCDRLAVATPADASHLAKAITKAAEIAQGVCVHRPAVGPKEMPIIPSNVVPSLLGAHQMGLSESATLNRRLQALLAVSMELSTGGSRFGTLAQTTCARRPLWRIALEFPVLLLLSLLFICVMYAKFYIVLNFH